LVAIGLIEGNIARQISETIPERAPGLFFIDIQPQQVDGFDTTVNNVPGVTRLDRVPMLRGRLVKVNGVPADQLHPSPDAAWVLRGDRGLTWTATPPTNGEIVEGEWWPADYRGPPLVSMAAEIARGFGIGVGDTITVNVLGREVEARIANLRDVDWRSLGINFVLVFAPGTLEGAPQTHIATAYSTPAAEAAIERAVTDRFPNVSAIRVKDALETANRMLGQIGNAIRGIGSITLLAGTLVLAGALAAGHRRRVYDAVVLKVLGATRRQVLGAFLIEYGVLGTVTGLIAAGVGSVVAWAVVTEIMRATWVFLPTTLVATTVLATLITLLAGFADTWWALGRKAAPLLRNA
jgi:putative ABC transport system permease protein